MDVSAVLSGQQTKVAGKRSVLTGRNLEQHRALMGGTLLDVYGLWDKDGGKPLRYEENTAELTTTLSSPLHAPLSDQKPPVYVFSVP